MGEQQHLDQLQRVLGVVGDALGPSVVGAYLYGSAVAGGLRPRSDVDILVVSSRRTTLQEKRRVVDGLVPISRRGVRPAGFRPVELTVVASPDVRPWRYPPRVDFQYGEWLHSEFESGNLEPSPASNADLAVLITMVLLGSRPLLGPAAADVLDPVPRDDLVRAMVDASSPCSRISRRTRQTSSSPSRGSGPRSPPGGSARRATWRTGHSRAFRRSIGRCSPEPARSTLASRRTDGMTSRRACALTRTTSSAGSGGRHRMDPHERRDASVELPPEGWQSGRMRWS